MLKFAVLFSMVIAAALSACLSPSAVENFDRQKFSGTWRYHTVIGQTLLGPVQPCLSMTLTGSDKYAIGMSYRSGGVYNNISGEELNSVGGSFHIGVAGKTNFKMVVLDTDYTSYASMYFCDEANPDHQTIEFFQRSKTRDTSVIEKHIADVQKVIAITTPRVDLDQTSCTN